MAMKKKLSEGMRIKRRGRRHISQPIDFIYRVWKGGDYFSDQPLLPLAI